MQRYTFCPFFQNKIAYFCPFFQYPILHHTSSLETSACLLSVGVVVCKSQSEVRVRSELHQSYLGIPPLCDRLSLHTGQTCIGGYMVDGRKFFAISKSFSAVLKAVSPVEPGRKTNVSDLAGQQVKRQMRM